ncbi:IQ domain-containing protein E-like [Anolis sagrei]|uniref:IQ domain-containing protein E-like n=1 Tax=Anolis sagrei TaxID=38937 RepID=UPI003521998D
MSEGHSQAASEPGPQGEQEEESLSARTYESDTELKLKKKPARMSPRSPKSPYTSTTCFHSARAEFSRSFKGTERKKSEIPSAKSSGQLWRGTLKQGGRAGERNPDLPLGAALSAHPGSTPEYLKEALGMKKPNHTRFSSSGYIPGTPGYKEKEDMYDEIIELKKTIQTQKNEADRMKTKLRRLEEETSRKDKQIEQLLDPSRGSDFTWLRPELRTDSNSVISGLKRKILKLEQQCKEKDKTIHKLQTDVKTTNVEEMKIALKNYYEESHRLQILLAKSKAVRRNSPESSEQKVLNTTILQFSRSIRELQEENRKLKEDLDRMLCSSPAPSKAKSYMEWSKQRLVRQIAKLEKKIDGLENDRLQRPQVSASRVLTPPASAHLDPSEESDPPENFDHLHKIIKKLKSQRVALQDQLALKEKEIQKLREKVRELEKNEEIHSRQTGIDATEPPDQSHSISMIRLKKLNFVFSSPSSAESHREEQAAQVIQRQWKAYKAKIEGDALDKAAVVLQAAFRGHLARQKQLSRYAQGQKPHHKPSTENETTDSSCGSSPSQITADCSIGEDDVRLIQSVFRAHVARMQHQEKSRISSLESQKANPVAFTGEEKPVWSPFRHPPLAFTLVPTTSSSAPQQPPPSPLADEIHSDDSDDIITVPPLKKTSLDFHSYLPPSPGLS